MAIKIRSIIQQAHDLAQITSEEFSEEVSGTQSATALKKLNQIVAQLNRDELFPYSRVVVEHTIVSSKLIYTMGIDDGDVPVIADIPFDRPLYIRSMMVQSSINANQSRLYQPDLEDVLQYQNKNGAGTPSMFAVDGAYPLTNIYFNIKPNTGNILTIVYNKEIAEFAIDDTLQIPPDYADVLVCSLAPRLAVNAPQELLGNLDVMYKKAIDRIRKYNARFNSPFIRNGKVGMDKMSRFISGCN